MRKCEVCNKFIYDSLPYHKCSPKFYVWVVDDPEDSVTEIFANDGGEAAKMFAEEYDADDYDLADDADGIDIEVLKSGYFTPVKYTITAEYIINYYAKETTI